MLLAGEWNLVQWVAGACVATVGATLAELARAAAGVTVSVSFEPVRRAASALAMVFVDFAILVAALARSLARREVVRGRFVARDFVAGGDEGRGRRAWTVLVAGFSPNAYVVDVDAERDVVLLHDLVPSRRSEEPA